MSYVETAQSTVEILQHFVAFSEYMNFTFEGCFFMLSWAKYYFLHSSVHTKKLDNIKVRKKRIGKYFWWGQNRLPLRHLILSVRP